MQLVSALLTAIAIGQASALHRDQAGQMEWLKSLVGIPSHVHFTRSHSSARLALGSVGTANTVSVLHAKNGDIVWRQRFPDNEALLHVNGEFASDVLSISFHASNTVNIRTWISDTGFILDDVAIPIPMSLDCVSVESRKECAEQTNSIRISKTEAVILLPGGHIVRVDLARKNVLWSSNIGTDSAFYKISITENVVRIVGRNLKSDNLIVESVGLGDGVRVSSGDTPSLDFDDAADCFALSHADKSKSSPVVCNVIDAAESAVAVFFNEKLTWVQAKPFLGANIDNKSLQALALHDNVFILTNGQSASIVRVAVENGVPQLSLVHAFSNIKKSENAVFTAPAGEKRAALVARFSHGKSAGRLEVFDLSTNKVVKPWNVIVNTEKTGNFVSVHMDAVMKNNVPTVRVLGITQDGSMALYSQKSTESGTAEMEVKWVRDESLAHVVDTAFVDLPDKNLFSLENDELDEPLKDSEKLDPLSRYIRRVATHLSHAQSALPSLPNAIINRVVQGLKPIKSFNHTQQQQEISLFTDRLGFRKLLILATASGKVHALETEFGRTVWTRYLPKPVALKSLRVLREGAVKFPPVLGLFGEEKNEKKVYSQNLFVRRMNAITGADFVSESLPEATTKWDSYDGDHLIALPVREEKDHLTVYAVVDGKANINLLPSTPESKRAFESIMSTFHFYRLYRGKDTVTGYSCVHDVSRGNYLARKMWTLTVPEGEVIADFAERDRTEPISSVGKVLGNRSVLYKFLNPNLLAMATIREESETSSSVFLYLVDTVTGSILHRTVYNGAGNAFKGLDSIFLVQVDNSVILSFYNHGPAASDVAETVAEAGEFGGAEGAVKKRRGSKKDSAAKAGQTVPNVKGYEIVVLEVYEMPKPDLRIESDVYSSFNMKKPSVLSQSYIFPTQLTAMGATRTGAGIASREILFGLASSQLYGVNKRLLDPRRPIGAGTAEDREEGLFPYRPVLDFNPFEVASHVLEVAGISKIVSAPTLLESTSIVAAYGLDLFVVRRAPSKTFDVLSEDFGYMWLIGTLAALLVGIQVAKHYAERKRVRDQWK
ncbi:DUF1620 super [Chytriomyces hyalinus]|nr:DUF1620 super [Chytriomyces hyalinus]